MQQKISYLRVILTPKCNLSCYYCHREGIGKIFTEIIAPQFLVRLIHCFHKLGFRKFKFMGGEPTLYKPLPEVLQGINKLDADISMISNGLFQKKIMAQCFSSGLQRINISIHAWSDLKLAERVGMNEKHLQTLKENLDYLHAENKLTKLNYVLLKAQDYNELYNVIDWINEKHQVLDILNFISDNTEELKKEHVSFDEILLKLRSAYNFDDSYIHKNFCSLNSLRLHLTDGGTINLKIFPLSDNRPFNSCANCEKLTYCQEGIKAIRLTYDGFLQPCLFRTDNRLYIGDFEKKSDSEIIKNIDNWLETL